MLWIPFRSDPNGRKISYRSAKPEWDTLLFHLGENYSLFRCVSGDSVDFGKFRQNQRIGRHAFWDFPLKKKNHCHWIFHRGDEKERAKRKEKKRRRWWRHEAQPVWERKYKRRRRRGKRGETRLKRAPEPLKIDETLKLSKWEEEEEKRVVGWDEKYVV